MRLTIQKLFAFSLGALLLCLALLLYQVMRGWEQTLLESSERHSDVVAREVEQRVANYLGEAPLAISQFNQEVKFGIIDEKNSDSIEQGLVSLLLANEKLS